MWSDTFAGATYLVGLPLAQEDRTQIPVAISLAVSAGLLLIGFTFALLRLGRGWWLQRVLRRRGYHWMEAVDGSNLWSLCGEAAFRLPPWQDAATLPGVSEGCLEALAELARERRGE